MYIGNQLFLEWISNEFVLGNKFNVFLHPVARILCYTDRPVMMTILSNMDVTWANVS